MTRSDQPGIKGHSAREVCEAFVTWARPSAGEDDPSAITPELVSATLGRRGLSLRFPPALERRFERDTSAARCRLLIWSGLASLILLNFFGFMDRAWLPDVFFFSVMLRLGVCTPIGLAMLALLTLNPKPWIRETTGVVMAMVTVSMIMILTLATHTHSQAHLPYGSLLVIMFACSVQVLRFPYLPIACAGVFLVNMLTLSQISGEVVAEMELIPGLILGGAVLGSIAGYTIERETRLAYLNGLLQRLYSEKLAQLSTSDPLTGVGNRRALDESVNRIARRSPRTTRMAAILIDIDHFKQFNDTYGHDAGDKCLRRVADILASEARATSDGVFRLGGEEFLVLLSDADAGEARVVAERMRLAIVKAAIPHVTPKPDSVVTASFGVASGATEGSPRLTHLIRAADAALYGSKHAGRNQVSVADPTLVELFAEAQANAA